MSRRIWIAFVLIALASLACSSGGAGPASQPEVVQQPDNVLFSDDFSNPSTGWGKVWDSNGTLADYDNGRYHIVVNYLENFTWGTTGRTYQNDVRIAVDASALVGSPANAPFGIMCRYTAQGNSNNFYMLTISSDGYALIVKIEDNTLWTLAQTSGPAAAIQTGSANNRLQADCIGSTLTLSVNGTQVLSVNDATFPGGDVGLIAGAIDAIGTNVLFDNFVVTRP